MATFVLIPGAGSGPWYWHLVEAELQRLGHDTVAVTLPSDDDSAGFPEYAAAASAAIGDRSELAIVAHSLGGFTGTLLAQRAAAELLVLVTAMIARPGESGGDWWANTGHAEAQRAQARLDGFAPDEEPPESYAFYGGVPAELIAGAEADVRGQSGTPLDAPWPLDAWPDVSTRFVLCTEDRFFPPPFMRALVADRLAPATPVDELPAGHLPMLSHPVELAALLHRAWQQR